MIEKIENWSDADHALKELCETQLTISGVSGEGQLQINAIKEAVDRKIAPMKAREKYLQGLIESFASSQKADFAKKRTRKLTFGEIAFKITHSMPIPRDKSKLESLIDAIKALGQDQCLKTVETPDKEALAELDDATLAKLGLKRATKDSFRIVCYIDQASGKDSGSKPA